MLIKSKLHEDQRFVFFFVHPIVKQEPEPEPEPEREWLWVWMEWEEHLLWNLPLSQRYLIWMKTNLNVANSRRVSKRNETTASNETKKGISKIDTRNNIEMGKSTTRPTCNIWLIACTQSTHSTRKVFAVVCSACDEQTIAQNVLTFYYNALSYFCRQGRTEHPRTSIVTLRVLFILFFPVCAQVNVYECECVYAWNNHMRSPRKKGTGGEYH